MLKRTLTAVILIAILGLFLVCDYYIESNFNEVGPIFIDLFILFFAAGATYEMFKCLKNSGFKMFKTPIIFALLFSYPVFYLMQYYCNLGIQGLLIVFFISSMLVLSTFTFKPTKTLVKHEWEQETLENGSCSINDLFANIFILVYPFLFMSISFILSNKYSALFAVLYAVFVPILGSDTFAYFMGSLIGGKKLCPKISPKKTVAGGIGGLIGGIVLSLLFWVVFEVLGDNQLFNFINNVGYTPFVSHSDSNWMLKTALIYIAIGLTCGFISELGDLAASKIKRAIGIKDYGKIFPGHGGFMDRLDSVMYCLVILLISFSCIYQY